MDGLRIVPAPAAARAAILDAMRVTSAWHEAALPWRFPPNLFEAVMAPAVTDAFRDPRGSLLAESPSILAAYLGPEMAGYVMLSAAQGSDVRGPVVVVDVWTAPAHRRRGIGAALLARVQAIAVEEGWDRVQATAWAGNDASVRLLRRAGFAADSQDFSWGPRSPLPPIARTPAQRSRWRWLRHPLVPLAAFLLLIWFAARP